MGKNVDPELLCMGCMRARSSADSVCESCGFDESQQTQAPHQLPCRSILNGKYLVGRVLGEGGFGITYLGWDLNLDMRVAIKEYYPSGFVTREATASNTVMTFTGDKADFYATGKEKFMSEAKTLAKFFSLPGIVSVKDFFLENNTAYIVMEYLEGVTLKSHLEQQGGKLPAKQVLNFMGPVLRALSYVHQAGLIHRDISPDNIMITKSGQVKLLDFGAARDISSDGVKSLSVLLKPGYAPEEQYRTHGVQGPWTDIYALCATMYKCMTGLTPEEPLERARQDTLQPASSLGAELTPAQDAAIRKGLSIYAEDRYQTVEELEAALYSADPAAAAVEPVSYVKPAAPPSRPPAQPYRAPSVPPPRPTPTPPLFREQQPDSANLEAQRAMANLEAIEKKRKMTVRITLGCAAALFLIVMVAWMSSLNSVPTNSGTSSSRSSSYSASSKKASSSKGTSSSASASALYTKGASLKASGDEKEAFSYFLQAANLGYAKAQLEVGLCYREGSGVEKDFDKALSWLEKAKAQGDKDAAEEIPETLFEQGLAYEDAGDDSEAFQCYLKAAKAGLAKAQNTVGYAYDMGEGVAVDHEEAFSWYMKAAKQDYANAQYNLGVCYAKGEGVEKDAAKAAEWYRKSAENGYANAQYTLGNYYYEGRGGLTKDPDKAFEWFQKAAEQGHAEAQNSVGVCYGTGTGVEKDEEKAFEWYLKSAKQGNSVAQYNVGIYYKNGKGVAKDIDKAVEWLTKAAEQGDEDAEKLLVEHQAGEW